MKKTTPILPTTDPTVIPKALEILSAGGVIAFPTDTVYGIACAIDNIAALERIYAIKGRDHAKALPVLVGDMDQIPLICPSFPPLAEKLARHFWPGALTLVVPRLARLPSLISSSGTIGVRMPDHPFTLSLLTITGPLAVTSANLSGHREALTSQAVLDQLDGKVDFVLDAGPAPGGFPSTVVECSKDEPHILREGPLTKEILMAALKDEKC